MESIDFDSLYWNSFNNITQIERYDDPNAQEPFETKLYEYEYTDDYYPKTAVFKTITENATNVNKLKWTY